MRGDGFLMQSCNYEISILNNIPSFRQTKDNLCMNDGGNMVVAQKTRKDSTLLFNTIPAYSYFLFLILNVQRESAKSDI